MGYKIDNSDKDIIENHKWFVVNRSGKKYLVANGKNGQIYMHRLIMGLKLSDGLQVDHINGNGLDNRRSNLRLATAQQNQMNKRMKTKYKGTHFHKISGRCGARIMIDRKYISLGYHDTQSDAAIAYNKKAKELFGSFAKLNEVIYES